MSEEETLENRETYKDKAVPVTLSKDEYVLAILSGVNTLESNIKPTPIGKSGILSHAEGALGEMMVCKYFGVRFNNSVSDEYPGDIDYLIGDYKIDVKATLSNNARLRVKKALVENGDANIYVNVKLKSNEIEYGQEGKTRYAFPYRGEIVGWKTSDWLENNLNPTDRNGKLRFLNYLLDWSDQNNIRELKDMIGDIEEEETIVTPAADIMKYMDTNWIRNRGFIENE